MPFWVLGIEPSYPGLSFRVSVLELVLGNLLSEARGRHLMAFRPPLQVFLGPTFPGLPGMSSAEPLGLLPVRPTRPPRNPKAVLFPSCRGYPGRAKLPVEQRGEGMHLGQRTESLSGQLGTPWTTTQAL